MADDLDDEWWQENTNHGDSGSDDASNSEQGETRGKKRKTSTSNDTSENSGAKKKKKKKRKRITEDLKSKEPSRGSSEELIQIIEQHFKGKLSTVEWDELKLDADHDFFISSDADHTSPSYFRTILPKWSKLIKTEAKPGYPMVLVISSSAIRAVELNRDLKDFKTDKCKCAKLFAKHFKLEDQQKYLQKTACHMGIGTPNRIMALLKLKSLHLDELRAIVLDFNWRDTKSKRIIDIPDVKTDLLNLMKDYLIPHILNSKCKIGIL